MIPDFRDESIGGSMIRAAAWLASEVGEGGIFTKEQLREALPGISQIDRRVRDLRKYGWQIEEYRDANDLSTAQQRLTKIGAEVWDKAARLAVPVDAITARVRDEVFYRDGHACVRCGISAGEYFDDKSMTRARLTAGHIYPDALGGKASAADLVTTCQRCNESLQQETRNYLDLNQVLVRAKSLGREQRALLLRRIETNRREQTKLDQVWNDYRQLPAVDREIFMLTLQGLV